MSSSEFSSQYFASLNAITKERYREKLSLFNLTLEDDPYGDSAAKKFVEDMSVWPAVEFGHIFCYFINRPGVYTQQEMLQWKQLDAYNYFTSGFVRSVSVWDLKNTTDCVIVKALVNPSMRSPEKPHWPWIGIKKSGDIVTAHCTCMAGYVVRMVYM